MKKIIQFWTFYLFLSLFLSSCGGNNNIKSKLKSRVSLEPVNESLIVNIGSNSRNFSTCIQYFSSNDSNFLAIATTKLNNIEIYNIDSKKLFKVVNIKKEGSQALFKFTGFVIKDLNSIIVFSPMPRLIGIINGNGEVLKKVSYDKDVNGKNLMSTLAMGYSKPSLINNTVFLSQEYRANESSGILTSIKQKSSNVNISVDLISGGCKSLPLTYPMELIGKDVSGMDVCKVLGYNNCFIYHFGVIDGLFVTNDNESFKKIPINTNYELKFSDTHWKYMSNMKAGLQNDLSHDQVQNMYYDSFRECYYIVVRRRNENIDNDTDIVTKFLYPNCFIIILDKDFKYLGDAYFPDNTYSFQMIFISPQGLYISEDHINNPSYSEDLMQFRLFKLKKL